MTDRRSSKTFASRPLTAAAVLAACTLAACHLVRPASSAAAPFGTCATGAPFSPPLWYAADGRIVGSVRDSAGAVVAPGRVLLTPLGDDGRFVGADLTPDGTFSLDSVAPARYLAHVVGSGTFAPLDAQVRVRPGNDSVRIVLGHSAPCR